MRKTVAAWTGIVLLSPFVIVGLLAVLLYFPPFQNWAVDKVAHIASEKTHMDISVERVRLAFPLDLQLHGFRAIGRNDSLPQVRDTIADVGRLTVNVSLRPLFHNKVVVNTLDIEKARFNTVGFIRKARVKGTADHLFVTSRGIDLDRHTAEVTGALIDGGTFDVALNDTAKEDTTKTETFWTISARRLDIKNTALTLHTPGDTLRIRTVAGALTAENFNGDLRNDHYRLAALRIAKTQLWVDNVFQPSLKGFDANHLALRDINISVDSIDYAAGTTSLALRRCSMKEKSGLTLSALAGHLRLDSLTLQLPDLTASTPDSRLEARVAMDLNAFAADHPGKFFLRLNGSIGKQDIMLFAGALPPAFVRQWPNRPLDVRCSAGGNLRALRFSQLYVALPGAFELTAGGRAQNPTDLRRLVADVQLRARLDNISFLTALAPALASSGIRIPRGITVDGRMRAAGRRYAARMTVGQGHGRLMLNGAVNMDAQSYKADLRVERLNLRNFIAGDSLGTLTAAVRAAGRGFDLLSPRCRLDAGAEVGGLGYGRLHLGSMNLTARLAGGRGHVVLDSHNPFIEGKIDVDALIDMRRIDAVVKTDLVKADMQRLRLSDNPLNVGGSSRIAIRSDLREAHALKGIVDNMTVQTPKKTFTPADLRIDMLTNRDTTRAYVSSGNLELAFNARGGYKRLLARCTRMGNELLRHYRNRIIDQRQIRALLPEARLHVMSGKENPLANFLRMKGLTFNELHVDMTSSPVGGLNGDAYIHSLSYNGTRLDTITFNVRQDSTQLVFDGRVENNRRNPQFVFHTLFDGRLMDRGLTFGMRYYDARDSLGLALGVEAEMRDNGINVHLKPYRQLLGYKDFRINPDNYIFLGRDRHISAKVDVIADDGTGVKIYTPDEDDESGEKMLQDITVSVNRFDLTKITSVLPYTPRIDGVLNGDFRVMMNREQKISVLSDVSVSNMAYEGSRIGNVSSEFSYLMRDSASHYVEGQLSLEGQEVCNLSGTYRQRGGGSLDATLNMEHTPLKLINGFIPEQLFGLNGYADGQLTVKGEASAPQFDGELMLDSAYLFSVPYGLHLRFDNDPVRIVGSHLLLENFTLYAHNNNPLNISGDIDFSHVDKLNLDMRMRAQNYLLIDSKKTPRSLAYGKAYVNFLGQLKGSVDDLSMRGRLDVLSNTDMTYVLKESPLNTDDQMKDLITFTDFRDTTTQVVAKRPAINGLDMQMMINVESGARLFCALNADQSNYVDVQGGGELRMVYNTTDELRLFGRYTMTEGDMKYSLPVIPLKTFHIKNGSYVEFNGDPMNPKLNIEATEEVKSSVATDGGGNRTVLFNCGLKVTQTLSNMGLEFTLDAPEDMTIKNQLAAMSAEKRGRLAVTMLSTGMYLEEGNTSGFSMNSALNSFLQSEINNITSSMMRTTDISLGMDQNSDAAGNTRTDYSFKFAKRFWNNRINFVIGGKISDAGSTAAGNQEDMFIDNVSIEYRLDPSAQRYVRMFYDKEAQDMLEDQVSEYGVGFVWRKKMDRLSELFRSKSKGGLFFWPAKKDTTRSAGKTAVHGKSSGKTAVHGSDSSKTKKRQGE